MAQSGINKVILLGNLGQDPEVRYTAGGVPIANVSIATSNSWKDKNSGETVEQTECCLLYTSPSPPDLST